VSQSKQNTVPAASRILVVDDDDDGRSLVKELLESDGYVVHEARDGGAALELLATVPEPALVILDLEMPVMSGGEVLDAMKKHERLARLPVLIVSGSGRMIDPRRGSVVGILTKPIDVDRFTKIVRDALQAGGGPSD
jgi:two-component system response regulator CpxR